MKRVFTKLASAALAAVMTMTCVPATDIGFIAPLRIVQAAEAQVGITEASGWLESAWVEWTPSTTDGVAYYSVSYSSNGSTFTTIDDELVRQYSDGHWRADLVGLAQGTYTVKVSAMNSSDSEIASETSSVTVEPHDRTGFNFSPESTCYDPSDPLQSGGYNGDGTPKANAEILYITSAADIDSVTDSTGEKGLSEILQSRKTDRPLIVRIVGKIDYSGSQLNGSGYIQVKPSKSYTNYQVTIEGIGEDASVNFGFLLRNAGNVEVRNLAIHDFGDDGISLDTDNCNVWLHNNEFFYGVQGSGDKAKGDGSSDVKNDSQYVTLSYNHYWDAGKCSLCGMKSESGENYITYHHNWFDHSDSRHPRIRTMFVHVYNNYYDGNAKYGVGTSADSDAFVEGNYFRNCKYPTLQGSVGHDDDGSGGSSTFDDNPPIGAIKLYNNIMEGSNTKFTPGYDGETDSVADGCVVETRNQRINYTTAAGATYSNEDVDNAYIQSLASVIEQPADARVTVEKYAGRTGGGNFAEATGFAFNDAVDDSDSEINTTLRTAITNYMADSGIGSQYIILSIGGSVDGTVVPEPPTESTTEAPTTDPEDPTESTTESSDPETPTESTTVDPSGAASMGTYIFGSNASGGDFNVNETGIFGNVDFYDVRDVSSDGIKLRSGNSISFSLSQQATLTLTLVSNSNPVNITTESGAIVETISAGTDTVTLNPGVYKIVGANNSNSTLTSMVLAATGAEPSPDPDPTPETSTETSTEGTTSAPQESTEVTTSAPVGDNIISTDTTLNKSNLNAADSKFDYSDSDYVYGHGSKDVIRLKAAGNITFTLADGATVKIAAEGANATDAGRTLTLAGPSGFSKVVTMGVAGSGYAVTTYGENLAAGTYTLTSSNDVDISYIEVTFPTEPVDPPVTEVAGDANGDGDVNASDVTYILAYAVGKETTVDMSADVNDDGAVTVADAYIISKYVLGIIDTL